LRSSRRGEEEFRVRLEKLPAIGVDDDFQRQEKAALNDLEHHKISSGPKSRRKLTSNSSASLIDP
jgi:hypothetical protein